MAVVKNFEDLECWKAARVLVNDVYEVLDNCRDFTFCDQMKRAALSVMNNIAE